MQKHKAYEVNYMKTEYYKFLQNYIDRLSNELDEYLTSDPEYISLTENTLFDTIIEIGNVFSKELPEIQSAILLHHGTGARDANSVLGILNLHMIKSAEDVSSVCKPEVDSAICEEQSSKTSINNDQVDNLNKFVNSYKKWFEDELPNLRILKDQYVIFDNWNGGTYYTNINYASLAQLHYGIRETEYTCIFDSFEPSLKDIKQFIEMVYDNCIDDKYKFTIETNSKLEKFGLPCRLIKGKIVSKGYKSSEPIQKIVNYEMCERKIQYADHMIQSRELLDKKAALDAIVDSLQYLLSLVPGKGVNERFKNIAIFVAENESSKATSVIRDELDEIMKIANEYFDIRHNEQKNHAKEKREPLNDNQFIEYLYNRIYALTYYLRLKNAFAHND